jgi:hypothetical protein
MPDVLMIAKLINTGLGILKHLSNSTNTLISKQEQMSRSLQLQSAFLERIEQKLDSQIIRTAKKSSVFLIDSLRCKHAEAKSVSLFAAYQGFTELICLDSNQSTIVDEHTSIPNEKLIALGYVGRLTYYCAIGSYRDALIQVYEFSSVYPELGVEIFDRSFFSKDYESSLRKLKSQIVSKLDIEEIYQGIPHNQLRPLLEMEEESLKEQITKESKFCLSYLDTVD